MPKFKVLAICILLTSCKEVPYQPPKPADMKEGLYAKYSNELAKAYESNNNFQVGIQLANLEADPKKVYAHIDQGIEDDSTNCQLVFEWYSIYEHFRNNVVQVDTLRFLQSLELCLQQTHTTAYEEFVLEKEQEQQDRLSTRAPLDPSLLDSALIRQMDQIYYDDQHLRALFSKGTLDKETEKALQKKVDRLDSINLVKIEDIIAKHGWPQIEQVGYDHNLTTWLVLHHQSDLQIRDKYQSIVEDNCGAGLVEAYNWRTANLRLE